jgi:mannose-1-phosphate guanylyltransferase
MKEIAVDHAIMERAENVAAIEADVDWSDIGSWGALSDVVPTDGSGNLLSGEVLAIDSRNVTAYGPEGKLMAVVGVEDLVVVDTPDALLVCRRDEAQRVKEVVAKLEEPGWERYA